MWVKHAALHNNQNAKLNHVGRAEARTNEQMNKNFIRPNERTRIRECQEGSIKTNCKQIFKRLNLKFKTNQLKT